MSTPTFRTYPRSTIEAFNDADRAGCVQGPYYGHRRHMSTIIAVFVVAFVSAVALAFAG